MTEPAPRISQPEPCVQLTRPVPVEPPRTGWVVTGVSAPADGPGAYRVASASGQDPSGEAGGSRLVGESGLDGRRDGELGGGVGGGVGADSVEKSADDESPDEPADSGEEESAVAVTALLCDSAEVHGGLRRLHQLIERVMHAPFDPAAASQLYRYLNGSRRRAAVQAWKRLEAASAPTDSCADRGADRPGVGAGEAEGGDADAEARRGTGRQASRSLVRARSRCLPRCRAASAPMAPTVGAVHGRCASTPPGQGECGERTC